MHTTPHIHNYNHTHILTNSYKHTRTSIHINMHTNGVARGHTQYFVSEHSSFSKSSINM